ncbi:TPA: hypothetical protein ACGN8S_002229 [Bacillus cereus]
MERYKEISLADLVALIEQNKIENVYFQGRNDELYKADDRQWNLDSLSKRKWFKREVIE